MQMKLARIITPLFLLIIILTVILPAPAPATESGGSAYPNGVEDFMAGALPPPGTYFLNYLNYYSADKFQNSALNDFKINAVADVMRFVHVTNRKVLGADWGMQVLVPVVYLDVHLLGRQDNRWGLGDIIFNPFILGWHSKNFHVTAGVDIFAPTGDYEKNHLANPGRNYWTFEPVAAATYLSDSGIELSGKFMYDFNTKNTDAEYQSGQEFHVDYALGYHIGKSWVLGAAGYYYQQTTDDELNGIKFGADGFKGRVWALGPAASYSYKNMSFALKYQSEFATQNKPEGDKYWFKMTYVF